MSSDQELREEEFLVLESVLSSEEFHRSADDSNSGWMEIFVEYPQGVDVFVIDSEDGSSSLVDYCSLGAGDPQVKTEFLLEHFTGKRVTVQHLPPIRIRFSLPETYPSQMPAEVCISASWLSRKTVQRLDAKSREIWNENGHQASLYEIFQFIKDEASTGAFYPFDLPCLPIFSSENFIPAEQSALKRTSAYFLIVPNAAALAASLAQFNDGRIAYLFQQGLHRCDVCFENRSGNDFVRLTNCRHFVCKACMQADCTGLIKDASVHRLLCLECQEPLNPFDIKQLVDNDTWDRYQKFQVQTALSSMGDVIYCPRPWCNQAVICEKEGNIAQCPECTYCFCKLCNKGFHGIESCKFDGDNKLLANQYESGDKVTQSGLEKKYGKATLQHLVNEIKAEEWLSGNTKPCPKCRFRVEKMSGCNKMICTKCGAAFCWICLKFLGDMSNPYEHYQNPANKDCFANLWLGENFDAESDDEDLNDWEAELPDGEIPPAQQLNFARALRQIQGMR